MIFERSVSTESSPGSVSAVTSWPSARSDPATASHAHAPSQKPGTRMIGAASTPRPYKAAGLSALACLAHTDDRAVEDNVSFPFAQLSRLLDLVDLRVTRNERGLRTRLPGQDRLG